MAELPAVKPEAKAPSVFAATAKSRIEFYGYAKLDMAYDTGRVYPGNFALYVQPMPSNDRNNSQYDMTANQSRLGMNFTAVDTGDKKLTGKVEIDFYGGGAAGQPGHLGPLRSRELHQPREGRRGHPLPDLFLQLRRLRAPFPTMDPAG